MNLPAFWNEIGKQISGRTAYKKIKIHFQSIQKLNYQLRHIQTTGMYSCLSVDRFFGRKSCFSRKLLPGRLDFFDLYKWTADITAWKLEYNWFILCTSKDMYCGFCSGKFIDNITGFVRNKESTNFYIREAVFG